MCHIISYQRLKDCIAAYSYGMVEDSDLLLGCKHMFYDFGNNKLISSFITNASCVPYEYKLSLDGDKIIIQEEEIKQEILFYIPVIFQRKDELELFGYVEAGLHISPLLRFNNNTQKLSLNRNELLEKRANCREFVFIVAFKAKDILFFDGIDVSVKQFMLISPNQIIRLLGEIENCKDVCVKINLDTNWLDDYKQIYSKLMQKLTNRR